MKNNIENGLNKNYTKWFYIWKDWTLKNKMTPSTKSKDVSEKKIATNMGNVLFKMQKEAKLYRSILSEYDLLYNKYGRGKDYKTKEEHYRIWLNWVKKNNRLPYRKAEDDVERQIALNMANSIARMRKDREKYLQCILMYEALQRKYHNLLTIEEKYDKWRSFVLKNKRLPSQKSSNVEEKRLCGCIYNLIADIKNNEKYKAIVDNYNSLMWEFGINKPKRTYEEHFLEWKTWTFEHDRIPNFFSDDKEEARIARNMARSKQHMKKDLDKYGEIVKEQILIHDKFKRSSLDKELFSKYSKIIEEWKEWVFINKKAPYRKSKDAYERNLAQRIKSARYTMKKDPVKFKTLLDVYDAFYKKHITNA